jgi:glycosyltransferase involved in cell wall biosynthesis
MRPAVIIPALNPDEKLITLAAGLKRLDMEVVIVNDGSGEKYAALFETLRSRYHCALCTHEINMGKGAALRTGIEYAAANYPECSGYVTADADGQHTPWDILMVANAIERSPDALILGTRDFAKKGIPLKSLLGNRITSAVFLLSTGKHCADTQTGLRGIPRAFTGICLAVPGDRYEYEMNLLMEMAHRGIPFISTPIATIYIEGNASSHFQPVKDSVRIYFNIIKYSLSSMISAATDLTFFTAFTTLLFGTGSTGILASTVAARLISGSVNFTINRHWVFQSKKGPGDEAFRYFALFCCQMLLSWLLVTSLSVLPLNITLIKILVDSALFFVSYRIQGKHVFNTQKKGVQTSDEKVLIKAI